MPKLNSTTASASPIGAFAATFNHLSTESGQDFQRLLDTTVKRYCPINPVERRLVDQIAVAHWRQIQTTNTLMNTLQTGLQRPGLTNKSVQTLLRYQKSLNQQLVWARRSLSIQQADRSPQTSAAEKVKFPFDPNPEIEHPVLTSKKAVHKAAAK